MMMMQGQHESTNQGSAPGSQGMMFKVASGVEGGELKFFMFPLLGFGLVARKQKLFACKNHDTVAQIMNMSAYADNFGTQVLGVGLG